MALLTGSDLVADRFFVSGAPVARGSSFDLTVGTILDHNGNKVDGPFVLKPGYMVQVVSAEVFKLPDAVTGHVTYKTALTRRGIWALTVGIVDPGWNGPVTTTLLNFSRIDCAVAPGDAFLRVSFFGHAPAALASRKVIRPTTRSSLTASPLLLCERAAAGVGDGV